MLKTLLIANRGEIAVRIIRTCQKLGIRSVAVYAENDANLPHVQLADEAVLLEGDTLAETYLNQDAIIAATKTTGAQAIHPGYGFLSENAGFSDKVAKAGIKFMGPSADAITLMGDKAGSRAAMEAIDVPLVPGYHGDDQSPATLKKQADAIGYPVMIKASAGGGGKGMRVVHDKKDFDSALDLAKSEARSAFGDDRILLEKYITRPRHIEVQVFSDAHGNHLHFHERECSIQRRHQKIVEEAPAPNLPDTVREEIFAVATRITAHIDYEGAGTIEFIYDDKDQKAYFLEMNTRLQVEHPVSEIICGQDFVALQIAIAEGKALPMTQEEIQPQGWAMEVRLYAEDPLRGFIPTSGALTANAAPMLPNLRYDNGYMAGDAITANYDPMISKLIAWGSDREDARATLERGLRELHIAGCITNRPYLLRVLAHEIFKQGTLSTHFLDEYADDLDASMPDEVKVMFAAIALSEVGAKVSQAGEARVEQSAWTALEGFRNG